MKSKIWIFVVAVILTTIIVSMNMINVNYISDLDSIYTVNSNGSIKVSQTITYDLSSKISNLEFAIYGPDAYESSKESLPWLNNPPEFSNVKVTMTSNTSKQETTLKHKLEDYGPYDNKIVVLEEFEPGVYEIEISYTVPNGIVEYRDHLHLCIQPITILNNYTINNMNVRVNAQYSGFKVDEFYLLSNMDSNAITNGSLEYNFYDIKSSDLISVNLLFDKSDSFVGNHLHYGTADIKEVLEDNLSMITESNNILSTLDNLVVVFIIILALYYIFLIFKYDYQNLNSMSGHSYEQVFDELNLVVGACIVQERNAEAKDIIGILISLIVDKVVILNVNKKVTENEYLLELHPDYYKNIDKLEELSRIEKQVIDFFFKAEKNNYISKYEKSINLKDSLLAIQSTSDRQIELETIVASLNAELWEKNHETAIVPKLTKTFNIILMVIVMSLVIARFVFEQISNYIILKDFWDLFNISNQLEILILLFLPYIIIFILYYFFEVVLLGLNAAVYITKSNATRISNSVNKHVMKSNTIDKKLFTASVDRVFKIANKYIFLVSIITSILYLILNDTIIIFYGVLAAIAVLIVVTDDYMKKYSYDSLKRFIGLKILEDKVIYGTFLDDKTIDYSHIWGNYIGFAFALGYTQNQELIKILNSDFELQKYDKEAFVYFTNPDTYVNIFKDINRKDRAIGRVLGRKKYHY